MMDDLWFRDRLEELAKEVGSLSYRLRAAGVDNGMGWQVSRLQARVEVLLCAVTLSAAELVREGVALDAALRLADEEKNRVRDMLGVRPR